MCLIVCLFVRLFVLDGGNRCRPIGVSAGPSIREIDRFTICEPVAVALVKARKLLRRVGCVTFLDDAAGVFLFRRPRGSMNSTSQHFVATSGWRSTSFENSIRAAQARPVPRQARA